MRTEVNYAAGEGVRLRKIRQFGAYAARKPPKRVHRRLFLSSTSDDWS